MLAAMTQYGLGELGDGLTPSQVFDDVPVDSPIFQATRWLRQTGITNGCGGNNYCPDDSVTRGQMALFLYRMGGGGTMALGTPPAGTPVSDTAVSGGSSLTTFIQDNKMLLGIGVAAVVLLSLGGRR